MLALGIGDSTAAIIGFNYGKIKMFSGKKTLEGTSAFVIGIIISLLILQTVWRGDGCGF